MAAAWAAHEERIRKLREAQAGSGTRAPALHPAATQSRVAQDQNENQNQNTTDDPVPPAPLPPVNDSTDGGNDTNTDTNTNQSRDGAPERLGEEPQREQPTLQFLRQQSVLLKPGQYQFDVSPQYVFDTTDFTLVRIRDDNVLQIAEAQRRQRLLLVPIELRFGLTPVHQVFINVPFGWSNSEIAFAGDDDFSNTGGIGDVSAGITKLIIDGEKDFPDILGTFAFSAPTGNSDFLDSISTPGSSLGQGFWTLTGALTFIQTYDPVVLFGGFGYRHRFENSFDGLKVNPGKQAFYRFGLGYAVNPRVTLSASFSGSYIAEDRVNDVRLEGSIREPMQIRLAATIAKNKPPNRHGSRETMEPFVLFGITESAIDSIIGISWTK